MNNSKECKDGYCWYKQFGVWTKSDIPCVQSGQCPNYMAAEGKGCC